jgi:O-antigen/teichoic acid export membrane protein
MPLHTLRDQEIISTFRQVSLPAMMGNLLVGPVLAAALYITSKHAEGFKGIAYFSWIQQLYMIGVFVPGALGGIFITRLSRSSDQTVALQLMKWNAAFAAASATFFYLAKPWLLGFAGFQENVSAKLAFDLMAMAIILYCLNATFASYWPASGRGWQGFAVNLLWAALFLATVLLGVNRLGAVSMALAYVIAYSGQLLAQTALYTWLIRRVPA